MKNNSKKICFLIYSLYGGGSERVVLTLSTALARKGYTVDIVLLRNIIHYNLPNEGVNIFTLGNKNKIKRIFLPIFIISSIISLKKFFRNKHYEFIISHSLHTSICCRFIRKLQIFHCIRNSVFVPQTANLFKNNKSILNNNFIARLIYNNQDLIAISNGIQEKIKSINIHPRSIKIIYNPLNIEQIQLQAKEYEVEENNYIIAMGRLNQQKRFDLLIQAYKYSNIRQKLIILGDGELRNSLLKLIIQNGLQDRVILKGFIQNPYPYIKKAQSLLLSSDFEGLPGVIIEALILGIPVVSTNCPTGPDEILIDELSSFLSPIGDVQALARNIQKVIADPPRIRDKYFIRFDMDRIAEKYLTYCLTRNNKIRSKSKKICFLVYSLYGGGAERVVLTLSKALASKGYTIDIVLLYNEIHYSIPSGSINTIILNKRNRISKFFLPLFIIQSIFSLKKFLRNTNYECIISHSIHTSICSRFIRKKPIYHCIHNSNLIPRMSRRNNINYNSNIISQLIYNNQKLITVSRGIMENNNAANISPQSIQTIYNPLDIEETRTMSEEYDVAESNYIIAIGRLHFQKRYDLLIQAYKQSGIQQKLLIFGRGILQNSLQKFIVDQGLEKRVILKGFIQNPYPYIKKAKALVLSSDFEGFGLVLAEALLLGTPVVSTDCPSGPNEILIDELSEFLSPIGNTEALARNIQKVIKNPPIITSKYYTQFDMNYIVEKYLNYCLEND